MQSVIDVLFCCKSVGGTFTERANISMPLNNVIRSFESRLIKGGFLPRYKEVYEYKLNGTILDKNSTKTLKELNISNRTIICVESNKWYNQLKKNKKLISLKIYWINIFLFF